MRRLCLIAALAAFLPSSSAFGVMQMRNIAISPEFVCPGQAITVTWDEQYTVSGGNMTAGVLSTNNTTWDDAGDFLFMDSGHTSGSTASNTAGVPFGPTTLPLAGGAPDGFWHSYSFVTNIPAGFTGTNVTVWLKGIDAGSNYVQGLAAEASLSFTTEVTCSKKAVYNKASFWEQESTARLVIQNGCGTPSNTPTKTVTLTPTPTRSPTSTFSSTLTSTITLTSTSTRSPTSTFTASPTATITVTATPTRSPSFTATDTITIGPSPTYTLTYTYTSTYSATPTRSPTPTWSPSNSPSPTYTATLTPTPTVTITTPFTSTSTPTVTPSFTDSPTKTVTLTSTASASATLTATQTSTFSDTPTLTSTRTVTDTPTMTATRTDSPTFTETATITITSTPSPTFSVSPTHSQTPVPVPFKLSIGVYNAAGEKVRGLYAGGAQALPQAVKTDQNLLAEGVNIVNLELGVSLSTGGSALGWDGTNDGGQMVKGGSYYFKLEFSDPFGKVTSMIQSVEVIDPKGENTLTIFNSAGEVVFESNMQSLTTTQTDLELTDQVLATSYDPVTGAPLNKLNGQLRDNQGGVSAWSWDGRNQMGIPVTTGVYTARLVSTDKGGQKVIVRSFTVISGGEKLKDPMPHGVPNPMNAVALALNKGKLRVDYDKLAGYSGIHGTLYNLAGEAISDGVDPGASGSLLLPFGERASGIYIVQFEALSSSGNKFAKSVKISVIR